MAVDIVQENTIRHFTESDHHLMSKGQIDLVSFKPTVQLCWNVLYIDSYVTVKMLKGQQQKTDCGKQLQL